MGAGKKLWGYYPAGDVWLPLQVDEDGKPYANVAAGDLGDIGDVTIAGLADGHFLSYSEGLGYWQNRLLAEGDIPDLDAAKITSGFLDIARLPLGVKQAGIEFIIDGGGEVITPGEKGYLEMPFSFTIDLVTMLADKIGSIVVDIWKTYYFVPPTDADSITAATPPTITATHHARDVTLEGWTTDISGGEILAFNVDSCAAITRVLVSLRVTKT